MIITLLVYNTIKFIIHSCKVNLELMTYWPVRLWLLGIDIDEALVTILIAFASRLLGQCVWRGGGCGTRFSLWGEASGMGTSFTCPGIQKGAYRPFLWETHPETKAQTCNNRNTTIFFSVNLALNAQEDLFDSFERQQLSVKCLTKWWRFL